MLKFAGSDQGRPVLGIGLTRENCEKLLAGESIQFDTVGMFGLPEIGVFVMAGENHEAICLELLRSGVTPGLLVPGDEGKVN